MEKSMVGERAIGRLAAAMLVCILAMASCGSGGGDASSDNEDANRGGSIRAASPSSGEMPRTSETDRPPSTTAEPASTNEVDRPSPDSAPETALTSRTPTTTEPTEPTPTTAAPTPAPTSTPTAPPAPPTTSTPRPEPAKPDPAALNRRLARTVNLGATLELAKGEYPWGPDMDAQDFAEIKAAGFTAVRIPIRWSDWAGTSPPYALDPTFTARVDDVLAWVEANGLAAIVNVHHYEEIDRDPAGHRDRLVGIWRQITERYRNQPHNAVAFEPLNEPNTELTAQVWNDIVEEVAQAIRAIDPERTLIVGPVNWNSNLELPNLELPLGGDNIIATFHYYEPFEFTHQGAEWLDWTEEYLGTRWNRDDGEAQVIAEFADVAQWSRANGNVPVFLGEFGVLDTADPDDAVAWTRTMRTQAEANGFSWGFFDWASPNFGAQNDETNQWNQEMLNALMG